jgi:hypothetical protein
LLAVEVKDTSATQRPGNRVRQAWR